MGALETLLERTLAGLGLQLADFEYINNGRMLRVFIDKALDVQGAGVGAQGISIADCESASRQLQRVLEVEGVKYERLEVSSPGLDRRLKKAEDFARFSGQEAKIRLRHPVEGRRNFKGIVRYLSSERVELEFDGGKLALDLAEIDRARLVAKP